MAQRQRRGWVGRALRAEERSFECSPDFGPVDLGLSQGASAAGISTPVHARTTPYLCSSPVTCCCRTLLALGAYVPFPR